jgi:uncharacterized protein (DUF2062 family)
MPRKLLKRWLPDHQRVREHRHLQVFGVLMHDANLWHLNRRSVAGAFAVGLFVAFIPIPFQMVVAAAGAILVRVNLLVAVALVWVTNPITMPPFFYAAYRLGTALLGTPPHPFHFELSFAWLSNELGTIWAPLLLGCLVLGAASATVGYLLVRALWRIIVVRDWRRRKHRRKTQPVRPTGG